ncbi:MAG: hypothetical protein A3F33_02685 [Candidatus Woykebacteria bacterium RIFCSPHIGHO2_12_FULL_43_10]|uniref:dTDP-4-dehydrorhamnose reductase n=2 Tax=Candidatus Woykeibacteriota TaxID=1817899 RepID=A0A1G1WVN0_9BACT|nr:MAG: hypothetical protein A3J50_04525 [Candidatus Woykebacteria bacterium RIFCSPHIGHO2_02_FULL_43_16b]OGY30338.1 MAG: hypothetical protein A3F33_02685 [Candidatus Woykebacteria bacterium RIFCSPHIGHO2_12_FULL_43_10]OGY31816.1 MAG: hypothetical protein A3A61_03630 [Candidatus Woykebacteria bacterium RIFCSPLOWO2_01_FULL_43_14]
MKILLTGGSGLIGTRILETNKGHQFATPDLPDFDITDKDLVARTFQDYQPDIVFHLAAYTNTQAAQSSPDKSHAINVVGTSNVLEACQKVGSRVLFFSTDFVFDGEKGSYTEEDGPNPIGEYAKHKKEAENLVSQSGLDYLIIRTAYPYRAVYELKSDCVRWMLPKLASKEKLTLVDDQYLTPTFVDELVSSVYLLVDKKAEGIYHVTGSECLSFLDMGKIVCEVWGFDKSLISGISLEEFNAKMDRVNVNPKNSCLSTDKLKKDFGLVLSDFRTGVSLMKKQLEV